MLNIDVSASNTVLEETFTTLPEIRFEFENIVAMKSDHTWPCIWTVGYSRGEISEALDIDPTVTEFTYLTGKANTFLYDIHVTEEAQEFVDIIQETGGTLLNVLGTEETWYLSLRFRTREEISEVHEQLNEAEMEPTIHRIVKLSEDNTGRSGLTDQQREAFAWGLELGYFDVPRQVTMEELATELGISHQALSERFRRGYETLVRTEFENVSRTRGVDYWTNLEDKRG